MHRPADRGPIPQHEEKSGTGHAYRRHREASHGSHWCSDPIIKPIRGGTDGSQLSFMGLPCPNIFAGGHNFHGKYEYVPVESMQKAVEVIVKICELVVENEVTLSNSVCSIYFLEMLQVVRPGWIPL